MTLPPPPVPADADLRHYDEMPLEVRRLRDSGIAGVADAEAFRCGLMSWGTAWHQIPAGSLPASDADLCRLVGLGRDLKTWKRIKPDAMRGWRLFADGRLYHPVVTEKVINGWNSTRLNRWSKECDRIRKENKARAERKEDPILLPARPTPIPYAWPPDSAWNSAGTDAGVPAETPKIPPENGLNRMEWNGRDKKKRLKQPSVSASAAAPTAEPDDPSPDPDAMPPAESLVDQAFALWAPVAYALRIPDPGFLNAARRREVGARLAECGIDGWALAMENLKEAKFLRDDDDPEKPKHWVNLANLLKPENFTGLLEGRYAERRDDRQRQAGNGEDAIAAGIRESLARRHLLAGG